MTDKAFLALSLVALIKLSPRIIQHAPAFIQQFNPPHTLSILPLPSNYTPRDNGGPDHDPPLGTSPPRQR